MDATICKHFTGIQNEQCQCGIRYQSVMGQGGIPCVVMERTNCDRREYPTQSEVDAHNAKVRATAAMWMKRMAQLMSGESRECLECHEPITALEQVGRCVYARPCGCRQYQGTVPDAWKVEAE